MEIKNSRIFPVATTNSAIFPNAEFLRAELLTFQDRDNFLDILDSLDSLDSGNFLLLVDNLSLWYFSHIETKRTLKVIRSPGVCKCKLCSFFRQFPRDLNWFVHAS